MLLATSVYWHLPIFVILVSLVYSATRFDDWGEILRHGLRAAVYMVVFMGMVFIVLVLLSRVVPRLF